MKILVQTIYSNYSVYVSPYFVASDSARFTKHYYAGTNRISSRVGEGVFQNIYRAGDITAGQKDYYKKMQLITLGREEYYKQLGIPPGPPTMKGIYGEPETTGESLPNGMLGNYDAPTNWPKTIIFNPPGDVPGPPIQWGDPEIPDIAAGYGFLGNHKPENNQYFYHSDHLGSTSYVTDRQGNAEQFVVYMPYGEALTEEHGNWDSPYKFNGKEMDAETGLYYYGARYYEPGIGMWYGVDPMTEKYPNLSSYNYCGSNPVKYIDPTGMDWYEDENKNYIWQDRELSKKEMKEMGYIRNKGKVFTDEKGTYYSLFGSTIEDANNSPNGKLVQKIDDAFIKYAEYREEALSGVYNGPEGYTQSTTDFSNIYKMGGNAMDRSGNIKDRKSLYANGKADVRLYVRDKNTQGVLSSIITKKEAVTGLISADGIGLKAGFHLHIGIGRNNDIATVSFYNEKDYEKFKETFFRLFPKAH
jgi:RHS repeat-associated protein